MSFPSRTRISKCFYCNEDMKDENLKKHCEIKHGKPKRVAGQSNLFSHFAPSAKRAKEDTTPSSSDEILLSSGGRKTPEMNIFSRPETPVELFEEKEDVNYKELIKIVKKIDINSENSLQEIKLLKQNVVSLESKLKKNIPEFAKPDEIIPCDERILTLRQCETTQDILDNFHELVYEKESESILCELCFVEKEIQGNKTPGQFLVDFYEEACEEDEENKVNKQSFYNLKRSVKRHFEAELHVENWKAWNHKNEKEKAHKKRNHEVGMRIARICYVDYKEGNSKRHFEQEVLKADLNGLDMGDVNHSDQFPRKFRPLLRMKFMQK